MAQTTGAFPSAVGQVEISTDGAAWIDISGSTMSLDAPTQARMSGETYTLEGDTAIITAGKREPMELAFSIVYTEEDGEAFDEAQTIFETVGGDDAYARWSPGGGDAGDWQYTSGKGKLISFTYPPVNAETGDPIMAGFTVKVAAVSKAVISS